MRFDRAWRPVIVAGVGFAWLAPLAYAHLFCQPFHRTLSRSSRVASFRFFVTSCAAVLLNGFSCGAFFDSFLTVASASEAQAHLFALVLSTIACICGLTVSVTATRMGFPDDHHAQTVMEVHRQRLMLFVAVSHVATAMLVLAIPFMWMWQALGFDKSDGIGVVCSYVAFLLYLCAATLASRSANLSRRSRLRGESATQREADEAARWLPTVLPVVLLPDDSVSLAIPTPSAEAEEAATATVQRMNWWARTKLRMQPWQGATPPPSPSTGQPVGVGSVSSRTASPRAARTASPRVGVRRWRSPLRRNIASHTHI